MVELDAGIGGSASAKGGRTPKTQRTRDWIKAKWQGRGTRRGVHQRSRSASAEHGETGRYEGGGALGEPPLPLGGRW